MKTNDAIILQSFLFKNVLNADLLLSQFSLTQPCYYQKNDTIFDKDRFEKSLGIILSGTAIAVSNTEKELPLTEFHEGDIFGAAALFGSSSNYVSKIIAQTDCAIQFISESELIHFFELDSQISVNYIRFLSEKIRFLNSKLAIFNEDNVESRLYRYLQHNSDEENVKPIEYSMTHLAETLGIGRTSLYRALDSLESKGLIIRKQKKIEVIRT